VLVRTGWLVVSRDSRLHRRDSIHECTRYRQLAYGFDRKGCRGRLMNHKENGENHNPHVVVYLTRPEEVGCYFLGWPSINWGSEKLENIIPLVRRK
jgi:hypothetical protein